MSFDDIAKAIDSGAVVAIYDNDKRIPQKIAILNIDGDAWDVRFLDEGDVWILKTAMKSRKAKKLFLKGES